MCEKYDVPLDVSRAIFEQGVEFAKSSLISTQGLPAADDATTAEGFNFDRNVTLELLRVKQAAFCLDRDWDQYHTPRNLLLALVGEVGELSEHHYLLNITFTP
jgi:hypothetical protein